VHFARELALQRSACGARSLRRARVDQVGDRLGLCQVDLPVLEGALGEFAGPRQPGAEADGPPDQQVHDHRPAVALQLQHVLAGERVGFRKMERDAGVDGSPAASRKRAKVARRGGGTRPSSAAAIAGTAGPETRTTPDPAAAGGVAAATMVSVPANAAGQEPVTASRGGRGGSCIGRTPADDGGRRGASAVRPPAASYFVYVTQAPLVVAVLAVDLHVCKLPALLLHLPCSSVTSRAISVPPCPPTYTVVMVVATGFSSLATATGAATRMAAASVAASAPRKRSSCCGLLCGG